VIVASSIAKSGSVISGNIPKTVVVQIDPGYDSNPGHAGTGTVISVSCPSAPRAAAPPAKRVNVVRGNAIKKPEHRIRRWTFTVEGSTFVYW